ncbi:MAG: TldD/PmbA family protein [Rhodospirillaceae bacterium]|nr:TldD/PmbA family protein [Rhodospirillaceae bacterium]MBT6426348.1 TldD/PmbA family protein [Rhodospirillaceae bacterium]MBT7759866.1 TldD/PmbA family protein [Rhodospirillaceae bacterium]
MPADMANDLDLLSDLVAKAKRGGADAADAVMFESMSLEVSYRLGAREDLERSESKDLGLRIFIGAKQAIVSSTDISLSSLDELLQRGLSMAAAMPDDPYCGLADPNRLSQDIPDLDLNDPSEPTPDSLYELAAEAEAAALAIDGVSNSESAGAGWGRNRIGLVTSGGFASGYATSSHSLFASVIAGEGTEMERDYDFSSARHGADLEAAAKVGAAAGQQAVGRLNPRKVESQRVPVVFDPRVSRSILGHFSGAISGASVARGTSFLKDRLGKAVFKPGVTIVDDPHRPRGLASKPFDGEGVANREWLLADDGVLTTWIMESASARQLKLETTGHASRGTSGPPSPSTTNLYMRPGDMSPEDMLGDIPAGLYITELIGFGVNGVTGDYSRGAAGFWIENGELAHPVSELTIAGNLKEMFLQTTPADDLTFRYGSNAPTLRIDGLTVAGT